MANKIKISLMIEQPMYERCKIGARHLNISIGEYLRRCVVAKLIGDELLKNKEDK